MKGMGISQHPRRKPMADINVVPYIDVMLVLLIIFMVTAPMMTQGVKVDLPETTSDPIAAQKNVEPIIVSVDSNGAYYMEVGEKDSKPLPLAKLSEQIGKVLSTRTQRDVLVRGDSNVDYGTVVRLMATLQAAGASSVGLITEEPQG
ncbi:MAG: protein TolR [Alteromonadaceae bacterium]|uniref:protein TolR n=1 Tax=unclassified Marinobacter TaxID=83889 RepID=UPI000C62D916|nr:protein TolR [Marinobacter sp. BGYM27]MAA65538.1 protein TolR [Alteromonadaceae bacterium]MBH86120.1 protein TolR [Alteromonadaceae bacterium]MDG5498905.1 protein TolR [Marinobacter sp. BGYM27]